MTEIMYTHSRKSQNTNKCLRNVSQYVSVRLLSSAYNAVRGDQTGLFDGNIQRADRWLDV